MSRIAYPRLWHMFGAFFHQDWDTEGDDWPDLICNFAQGQSQDELEATAVELDRLLNEITDATALEQELFHVLGCEYDPRPDLGGPTLREWLGQVASFLRQEAR
ncbi:MAG: contact-dependent growth inhibition system immunity protein [Planctomycetota bacterium]